MIECLHLLACGSPFVFYHEFMEPLVECYHYLLQREIGVRMVLADTWYREFQVLPGRTHPNMFVPTSGGYLLFGIYIGTSIVKKEIDVKISNNNGNDNEMQIENLTNNDN